MKQVTSKLTRFKKSIDEVPTVLIYRFEKIIDEIPTDSIYRTVCVRRYEKGLSSYTHWAEMELMIGDNSIF